MVTAEILYLHRGKKTMVNLWEYPTVLHLKLFMTVPFPSLQGFPMESLHLTTRTGEILSDSKSLESCDEAVLYLKILPLHRLRCPACNEAFPVNSESPSHHRPVLLQCGHSICKECFQPTERLLDDQEESFLTFECAVETCQRLTYYDRSCQSDWAADEKNLAFARECFLQSEQLGSYASSTIPRCRGCAELEEEVECETCNTRMCQSCSDKMHQHFPDHSRRAILDVNCIQRPPPPCKAHHENSCTFFCSADRMPICSDCRLSNEHVAHDVVPWEEHVTNLRDSLVTEAQELCQARKQLYEVSDEIDGRIRQAKADLTSSNDRIVALFNDVIRRLQELKLVKLKENSLQFNQLMQALITTRKSLKMCLSSLTVAEEERELAARQPGNEAIYYNLTVPFQETVEEASRLSSERPDVPTCPQVSLLGESEIRTFMRNLCVVWNPNLSVDTTTAQTSLAQIRWKPFGADVGVTSYSLETRIVDNLGLLAEPSVVELSSEECRVELPLLPFSDYEVKMTNITTNGQVISVNYPSSNRWKTSGKNTFISSSSNNRYARGVAMSEKIYKGLTRIDGSIVAKTGSKEIGFWEGKLTFPPTNAVAVGLLLKRDATKAYYQQMHVGERLETDLVLANRSFTVSCWINIDSFPSNQEDLPILGQEKTIFNNTCLHLVIRQKKAFFSFYGNDTAARTEFVPGQWYHLIFSYNMQTRRRFIFLNGCLDGSTEGVNPLQSREKIFVSCYSNKGFEGKLSDLTVWDGCLDDENSVKALYINGACDLTVLGRPLRYNGIDSSPRLVTSHQDRDFPGLFLRDNGEVITSPPTGGMNKPDPSSSFRSGDTVGVLVDCRKEPTATFYRNRSVVAANVPLSATLYEIPVQPAVWSMSLASCTLESSSYSMEWATSCAVSNLKY